MSVKICIITTVHSPFDVRIFHKECKTLAKAGYKVSLIAPCQNLENNKKNNNREEIIDGIKIIYFPKAKNRLTRIFFSTRRAYQLALEQKADIYHFHDPEIIILGIILKILGKKVIYDVHEDILKQIMNKGWLGNNQNRRFAAFTMNIIEQIGAFLFNKIIAATPDIARKFPKKKTIILRNFPILELIDNIKPVNYKKEKPIIIYAGGLAKIRGIKEIIQTAEYINDEAELWLLGKWESEEFRYECENLKGWKYTKYLGLVLLEEVFQYMKIVDIGISTFHPVKNYLTSLPIKAFEYMACSLPMVMSDFLYFRKFFKECAVFVDPFDSKDITEKILYLINEPDKAKELGKKGRKLIEEKYNWEIESKKLIMVYNSLLGEGELE